MMLGETAVKEAEPSRVVGPGMVNHLSIIRENLRGSATQLENVLKFITNKYDQASVPVVTDKPAECLMDDVEMIEDFSSKVAVLSRWLSEVLGESL